MQYGDPFAGDLFMANTALPAYYSIDNALNNLFAETQLNYQHCMLTIGCNTVAIFKTSEGTYSTKYSILIQEIYMGSHTL
jgi:hypothetical protein